MKYNGIILAMTHQYFMTVDRIKKEIINILKENGNIIEVDCEKYDTPILTMFDDNGSTDDVTIKSIELEGNDSLYVNGISSYSGDLVSYEVFNEQLYWILNFIQIWDEANN